MQSSILRDCTLHEHEIEMVLPLGLVPDANIVIAEQVFPGWPGRPKAHQQTGKADCSLMNNPAAASDDTECQIRDTPGDQDRDSVEITAFKKQLADLHPIRVHPLANIFNFEPDRASRWGTFRCCRATNSCELLD
jgi:hypothetical protein